MSDLQILPWVEPLALAAAIREPRWVLLYSGTQTSYSGRYSFLAHRLQETIEAEDFERFGATLPVTPSAPLPQWFGYLGYGLKNTLETLPSDTPGGFKLAALCMMRFGAVYRFDHQEKRVEYWGSESALQLDESVQITAIPAVANFTSNMSDEEYLQKAQQVIDAIHEGALYQANLTRKYFGRFESFPDAFALFKALCANSPAPYSAIMALDDSSILSSSPELFLRIDSNGIMESRPIKGTKPRDPNPSRDAALKRALEESAKDKAENLMIVDLMRNDFSRACLPESVHAEQLFEVTSHANVHHMASTVTGKRRADVSTLEAVQLCFPPGSMTGAPKIRAMQLCSELEKLERGVYSGVLGWFDEKGACELSVVIRTLLVKDDRFEFQVGGGIVSDSTPQGELAEIRHKASAILKTLGISGI